MFLNNTMYDLCSSGLKPPGGTTEPGLCAWPFLRLGAGILQLGLFCLVWFFVPEKGKIKYVFTLNTESCLQQKKAAKFIEAESPKQILPLNHGFQ